MKVWVLGSGSSGNAVLLESDGTRLLVDAGFGPRTLATRLRLAGVDARSVTAGIVTHDHSDHICGAGKAAKRWGWQIFATDGTAAAPDLAGVAVATVAPGGKLRVGSFGGQTVAAPPAAAGPVGLAARPASSGARARPCSGARCSPRWCRRSRGETARRTIPSSWTNSSP